MLLGLRQGISTGRETLGCFITDLEEHTRKDILLISTAWENLKMMSYVLPKKELSTWPIILGEADFWVFQKLEDVSVLPSKIYKV